MNFSVITDHPVAFDSHDHLHPFGTSRDNSTSAAFINDLERTYSSPIKFMDVGCSGGLLVHDMLRRGHLAVGLEGSNYSYKHKRAEWPALHKKNLFTCDVSREYSVIVEDQGTKTPFLSDVITAWEVVEHIPPDRLETFFAMLRKHLRLGGQFFASVSTLPLDGYHQSVFSKQHWYEEILPRLPGLKVEEYPYPLANAVRCEVDSTSFMLALSRSE